MATELVRPSRIERRVQPEQVEEPLSEEHNRPGKFNFICMIMFAIVFDVIGLFVNEAPFVGAGISVVVNLIFIPWFHFSGMKFNSKRISSMGVETLAESIPFVGNLPLITLNVIYSYYSN